MKREDLELYFIMGTSNVPSQEQPIYILEKALQAGITMFQFREKGPHALTGLAYEQFARQCQKLCHHYKVPFIINDDVDLAIRLGADGVHIGQDDLPVSVARKRIGNMILGVSVHCEEELQIAINHQADYVGIGPIYQTKSKPDAKKPAGVTFLHQARIMYPEFPVVAIGGITEQNASEVVQAGADGVAVISAICESPNIPATVQSFHSLSQDFK